MRINQFVAQASGLSRRAADQAIQEGRVTINGRAALVGQEVTQLNSITLDGNALQLQKAVTIMLNKPAGYVTSRQGQGSKTIYELLPKQYRNLKPIGRLDKDSSGLLLLTNDGNQANRLTHPRYNKIKVYEVELNKPLASTDRQAILKGIQLDDGTSQLKLNQLSDDRHWQVTMSEGRNRQIRRTFAALGYNVTHLHRTRFGDYELDKLQAGGYTIKQ